MKSKNRKAYSIVLMAFLPLMMSFFPLTLADQQYTATNNVKITVLGTSNIHDWDLISDRGTCSMVVQHDAAGAVIGVNSVSFSIPVSTLKSKHGATMDNNAYKAMNASGYPNVSFRSNSVSLKSAGGNTYNFSAPGKLTISNGSRDITLNGVCKVNADKSLTISGSYKLKTTDYNVKPISIMLGTIKTSEDVTIQYSLTAKPQ